MWLFLIFFRSNADIPHYSLEKEKKGTGSFLFQLLKIIPLSMEKRCLSPFSG